MTVDSDFLLLSAVSVLAEVVAHFVCASLLMREGISLAGARAQLRHSVVADILFASMLGAAGVASTDQCLANLGQRTHLNLTDPLRVTYAGADSHMLKWL